MSIFLPPVYTVSLSATIDTMRSSLSCQHDDVFYVAGLWEEVHRLNVADVVMFAEFGEVTGEGGWVAADVENAWKLGAHEGVE